MIARTGLPAAMFARSCRSCRGTGEIDGLATEWRAWINEHDDLVVEHARLIRAFEQGTVTWEQVQRAGLAVDLHRLVAPGDLCEDCAGAGHVLRQRRRPVRRRR